MFCWRKKEKRIWAKMICLKLYQFKRITWWCLYVLKFALHYVMKIVMLENNNKESHGLMELVKIPGDHETLSIVHHVGLHVDFSSMKSSLDL